MSPNPLPFDPRRPAREPQLVPAPARRALGGGRLRLALRTAVVALQVAWFALLGWVGATLTLLPLAIQGAPLGRELTAGGPQLRLPARRARRARRSDLEALPR